MYLCVQCTYTYIAVCRFFLPLFSLYKRNRSEWERKREKIKIKGAKKKEQKKEPNHKTSTQSYLLLFCGTTSSNWGKRENVREWGSGKDRKRPVCVRSGGVSECEREGKIQKKSLLDQFFCRSCNVLRGFQITRRIKYIILGMRVFHFRNHQ